ncbi:MAG: NADH-quinone oxidoreductase subunit J [bacterium]|nr:NADH-quinone oxidoreductase subunit J [bacterium]
MVGAFFFWIFAFTAFFAGVGVVASRNPMHSAISLVAVLISIAGLFLALHAEFLAWILVIVYTGAVMVLIVFVISLLNLDKDEPIDYTAARRWGMAALTMFIAAFLVYLYADPLIGAGHPAKPPVPDDWGSVQTVAIDLFTRYMIVVQLAGVLLTAAVIGAVVVARKPEQNEEREPGA